MKHKVKKLNIKLKKLGNFNNKRGLLVEPENNKEKHLFDKIVPCVQSAQKVVMFVLCVYIYVLSIKLQCGIFDGK